MQSRADASVFIVEDDRDVRDGLAILFELEGFEVATARNGRDALDQLMEGLRPAVIVLDLRMPEINGVGFREVQRCVPSIASIPVIVFSSEPGLRERAAELGATDAVEKPALECLLSSVRSQLARGLGRPRVQRAKSRGVPAFRSACCTRPASSAHEPACGQPSAEPSAREEERRQRIAERAYLKGERRGWRDGSPEQDWIEAEAEIAVEVEAEMRHRDAQQ